MPDTTPEQAAANAGDPTAQTAPAAAPIVSPEMKAAAILRLEAAGQLPKPQQEALNRLRKTGQFPTINVAPDDPTFDAAETKYGLPHGLLHGIHAVESGGKGNAEATSPTGVRGLMQVTLATGAKYGLTAENRSNPYLNIDIAARHLHDLLGETGGDVQKALQRYKGHGPADASDAAYIQGVTGVMQQRARAGVGGEAARTAAPSPAPQEAPQTLPQAEGASTTTTPTTTSTDAVTRASRAIVYDGIALPLANLNALEYSFGVKVANPTDYRKQLMESPIGKLADPEGMASLPTQPPTGFWDRLSAASAVTEPLYAPTFGSYVASRTWGASEHTARAIEGVIGLGALGAEASVAVANIGAARRIKDVEGEAARAVQKAQDSFDAAKVQGQAAKQNAANHIASAPDMRELGENIQETGTGIASQVAQRTRTKVHAAYNLENKTADDAGIVLPRTSSHAMDLADTANTYSDTVAQMVRAGGSTPSERVLADKIARMLGSIRDPATGEFHVKFGEPDIPYSALRNLQSEMGVAAISPEDYPVSNSAGRKLFSGIRKKLESTLDSLASGHPDVAEASSAAKAAAKEQFKLRKTIGKLTHAETPEAASGLLLTAKASPTRLLRMMREASPSEVSAMQAGGLRHVYEAESGKEMLSRWNHLPIETRKILAAQGVPEAQTALSNTLALPGRASLSHPAFAEAERAQGALLRDIAELEDKQSKLAKTISTGQEKVLDFKARGGSKAPSGGFMARRSLITLAMAPVFGMATGRPVIGSAGFLYLSMVYPKLVRAAIRTPFNTEHGMRMVGAIAGILNARQGLSREADQDAAQSQAPDGSPSESGGGPGSQ